MVDGDNLNVLKIRTYGINNPIRTFNKFSYVFQLKFWNYTAQIRCVRQALGPVEQLLDYNFCIPDSII